MIATLPEGFGESNHYQMELKVRDAGYNHVRTIITISRREPAIRHNGQIDTIVLVMV